MVDVNETTNREMEKDSHHRKGTYSDFSPTSLFYVSEIRQWPWSSWDTASSFLDTVTEAGLCPQCSGAIWIRGHSSA